MAACLRFTAPVIGTDIPGLLRSERMKEVEVCFGFEDIRATLEKVVANSPVFSPRAAIQGVVILSLITDPAGNCVGLVEMEDGRPVVS